MLNARQMELVPGQNRPATEAEINFFVNLIKDFEDN